MKLFSFLICLLIFIKNGHCDNGPIQGTFTKCTNEDDGSIYVFALQYDGTTQTTTYYADGRISAVGAKKESGILINSIYLIIYKTYKTI